MTRHGPSGASYKATWDPLYFMVKIKIPRLKRGVDSEQQQSNKRQRRGSSPQDPSPDQSQEESSDSDNDGIEIVSVQAPPKPSNFRKTQCPVCLDTPDVLVSTECGHLYCYDCVFAALASTARAKKTVGECSVCRTMVRYDRVTYLQMRKRPVQA